MTSKKTLLNTGVDPWPPTDPTEKAVTDFGLAIASLVFTGEADLGSVFGALLAPVRQTALVPVTGGTFHEVTLSQPGTVYAATAQVGVVTGPLLEDSVGTPGTGQFGVIYDSAGIPTIRLEPADVITSLACMQIQLPAGLATVLAEDVP